MRGAERGAAGPGPALLRGVALAWGLAEAVLFFVIPDVWITWVALHGLRRGLAAAAWTLAGALAGGLAVYLAARSNQMLVLAVFDRLPAIGDALMLRALAQMQEHGWLGLVLGGFSGVPYKLFAAMAEGAGLGMGVFLAATAVARGLRFAAFALAAWLLARWLRPRIGLARVRALLLGCWALGYTLYWALMPE